MTKATTLKAGKIIESVEKPKLQRKAMMKQTNDMSILPTHEIVRRLYIRHKVGVWQLVFLATWAGIIWNRFN